MIGIQKSKRTPDTEASVSTPSIDKEGDCWQRKNRRGRAERNLVKQICPEIYPRFWSLKGGKVIWIGDLPYATLTAREDGCWTAGSTEES